MSNNTEQKTSSYNVPIVVTIATSFVAVLGLIALLILTGHDTSNFLNAVIVVVGLLPSIGVIGFAVTSTARKTDTVVRNTNGNLSKLQAQNQALAGVATPDQIVAANNSLDPSLHLPVTAPVETVVNDAIAAVPTPAELQALTTPVTPMNVTSGAN